MFNKRKGLASRASRLNSDTVGGAAVGSTLTLALVLICNLLMPPHAVEQRVLEVARQALYGIPLPP